MPAPRTPANPYLDLEERIDAGDVPEAEPAAEPAAPANPYLELEDALDEDDAAKDAQLTKLFQLGLQLPPDQRAGVLYLARETGLKPDLVESQYELFERQARAAKFDPRRFRDENPGLVDLLLQQPQAAGVVMMDEQISGFTRVMKGLSQYSDDHPLLSAGTMFPPGFSTGEILDMEDQLLGRQGTLEERTMKLPAVKQVPTVVAPEAESKGLDRLSVYGDVWGRKRRQSELSTLGSRLLFAEIHGDDTYEIEKRIVSLQQELGPARFYDSGPIERVLLDGLEAAGSQVDSLEGAGAGYTGGFLLGAGVSLLARQPGGALKAGHVIGKIGGATGAFLSSFNQEMGGTYLDLREQKTDDGKPIDREIARGAAVTYGLLAAGVEVASLGYLAKTFGPLEKAFRAGEGRAFLRAMVTDRTKAAIFRDVAKAWSKGALSEGVEEAVQQSLQTLTGWGASSITAGEAQRFDGDRFTTDLLESFYKGTVGGAFLATPGSTVNVSTQLALRDASKKSGDAVAAIAGLPASPSARAAPKLVKAIVEQETARSGEKVENLYVDAPAFVRLFQAQGVNPDDAARELMGEEGPQRLQQALAGTNQGRLEVGLEEYLGRWGDKGVAEALAPDTAARPGVMTVRELQEVQQKEQGAIEKRAESLVKAWEQAAEEGRAVEPESESAARLTRAVEAQLVATGVNSPKEARTALATTRAFLETMAESFGMPAEALFEHHAITVERQLETQGAQVAAAAQRQQQGPAPALPGGETVVDVSGPVRTDAEYFDQLRYEQRLKTVQRLEAIPEELDALYQRRLTHHLAEAERNPDAYAERSAQDRADAEVYGRMVDWGVRESIEASMLRGERGRLERYGYPGSASTDLQMAENRVRQRDAVRRMTPEEREQFGFTEADMLAPYQRGSRLGPLTANEVAQQVLSPEARELAERIAAALDDTTGPAPDAEVVPPPGVEKRRMQIQNLPEWEVKVRAWMENQGRSKKDIEQHLAAMRGQMKIFSALGPVQLKKVPRGRGLNEGPKWTKDPEKAGTRSTTQPGGPLRDNQDDIYVLSFDLSAMCVKRLEAAATIAHVQKVLNERAAKRGEKPRALTMSDRMALAALFKESGKTAPCLYCYVEAPRAKSGELVEKALAIAFGEQPVNEGWAESTKKLALAAIAEVQQKGLKADDADPNFFTDPEVAESPEAKAKAERAPALYAFMKQMAASVTVNKPKLYEEYTGQILDLPADLIEELNGYAGFRFFSSSDFQFEHVADLMQAFFDLAAQKAKSHAYTKVVEYVEIFGATGQKIQTSIFATRDEAGNIVEDSWQGMGWEDAKRLRAKFPDVGTVLVATDDEMVRWGLDQPWVDYIIPFHHSGLESRFFNEMGWKSYQSVQTEKWADPARKGKPPKIRMWELRAEKGISDEELTKRYLKLAKQRGIEPVFPQFADHPRYAKLKKDYARTDSPFRPVEPRFDLKKAEAVLNAFFAGEAPAASVDKKIAKKLVEMIERAPEGVDIGVEALRALNEHRDIVTTIRRLNQPALRAVAGEGRGASVDTSPEGVRRFLLQLALQHENDPLPEQPGVDPAWKTTPEQWAAQQRRAVELLASGKPRAYWDMLRIAKDRAAALADAATNDIERAQAERAEKAYAEALEKETQRLHLKHGSPADTGVGDGGEVQGQVALRQLSPAEVDALRGRRLFQGGEKKAEAKAARAWVDVIRQGLQKVFKITLTQRSDLSSFLHENAHTMLEMLLDISERPDAPQRVKDNAAAALQWLGAPTRADITEEMEEKWARAFEGYLLEGKAPSSKLVAAFTQFRLWLLEVYKTITALDVELDDQIRGVFDRLLATDAEIELMKRSMGIEAPLFRSPEEAGMTPEQYQAYLSDREKTFQQATLETARRVLADRAKATERWWQEKLEEAKKAALEDYDRRPDVRALAYVKRGEMVLEDGRKISDGDLGKLDRAAVAAALGGRSVSVVKGERTVKLEVPPDVEQLLHGRLPKEGGEHPDDVARRLGYASGRELLEAIRSVPNREQWAEAEAERRMQEAHPDILEEKTKLADEAAKALHNAGTSDWLLKEYAALRARGYQLVFNPEANKQQAIPNTLIGLPAAPIESIRLAAKEIVRKMKLRGLSPHRALQDERKAAEQAAVAAAKGDFKLAAVHKQQQLLAHEVYRELDQARDEREAFEKLGEKLTDRKRREILGKAGRTFLDAADQILEALGFKDPETDPEVLATRKTMPEVMKALEDAGIIPGFEGARLSWLVAHPPQGGVSKKGNPQPGWKELTVEDMRTVGHALAQLYTAARDANRVLLEGKQVEIQALADDIAAEAKKRPKKALPPGSNTAAPPGYWAGQAIQGFSAALTDPQVILEELGPTAYRFFWRGYNAARAAEEELAHTVLKFFAEKWDALPEELQRRRYDLLEDVEQALPLPADLNRDGRLRDREWLWMVALNMGNRSNMERLLGGYGWKEQQVREYLDKTLTDEEWTFIEGVWALLDEQLWPKVAEAYEKVNGIRPEKIEALPFQLSSGRVIRGGYFPARYDPVASRVGADQDAEALQKMYAQKAGAFSVAKSFTKERVKEYTDVINLQWNFVPSHVANVVHYITHDQFVRDAARVLTNATVKAAVEQRAGGKYYGQLKAWLRTVAVAQNDAIPEELEDVYRPFTEARSRAVIASLGYSLTVAAADFTNPLVALATGEKAGGVARKYLFPALLASLKPGFPGGRSSGFRVMRDAALAKSPVLKRRADNMRMMLRKQLAELGTQGKRGRVSKFLEATRDTAWIFMEYTDRITSTVIWEGAYRQALARGVADAEARLRADDTVQRMLPSHDAAEQPAFLRDRRGMASLVMFYGYFNKLHNIRRRVWRDAYEDWGNAEGLGEKAKVLVGKEVAVAAGRTLAIFFVANVLGELISGRGPDEDEGVPEWVLRKLLIAPVQTIPLAGSVLEQPLNASIAWAFHGEAKWRTYSLRASPALAAIERLVKAGEKALKGDELDEKLWALLEALGVLLKTPLGSSQVGKTGRYLTGEVADDIAAGRWDEVVTHPIYGERDNGQPANPVTVFTRK